jgi:hypothetical protein
MGIVNGTKTPHATRERRDILLWSDHVVFLGGCLVDQKMEIESADIA